MTKRTKDKHKTSFYASDQILDEFKKNHGLTEVDAMMILWMAVDEDVRWSSRIEASRNPNIKSAISNVRKTLMDSCPTMKLVDEFLEFVKRKKA